MWSAKDVTVGIRFLFSVKGSKNYLVFSEFSWQANSVLPLQLWLNHTFSHEWIKVTKSPQNVQSKWKRFWALCCVLLVVFSQALGYIQWSRLQALLHWCVCKVMKMLLICSPWMQLSVLFFFLSLCRIMASPRTRKVLKEVRVQDENNVSKLLIFFRLAL